MKIIKKLWCCELIVFCNLLLAALVSSKNHGNPANDLVDIINKNRTAVKLSQLSNNPGLGCMALQYVEQCKGNCSSNNTLTCEPSEDDFTEVFAPNCGVELPTFGTVSGRIFGCQHKYLDPSEAFLHVVAQNNKIVSLLRNKTFTEVGVGLVGAHKHKGPYFWCVLLSNSQRNTTFVLQDLGEGIKQKKGCYSGTSTPCSGSHNVGVFPNFFTAVLFSVYFLKIFL
ncbi:uncharacterized protein LOC141724251 isoform X1 [Apium graveolens]|uniref:uncharacterized protein LOC141724251 isoform X1 n=1 Tax=Apium graveolens TaxID=4045 RepID=UPI003D79B04C